MMQVRPRNTWMGMCIFPSVLFVQLLNDSIADEELEPSMQHWASHNLEDIGEPFSKLPSNLPGVESQVDYWRLLKPWNGTDGQVAWSDCYRLPKAVPRKTVNDLLEHFVGNSVAFTDTVDSVDGMPAFEFYAATNGQWHDKAVKKSLQHSVKNVILPFVRNRFSCQQCSLSDVLVRRYVDGERRTHDLHFDGHAFATVVLGLSPPTDYVGGLFVSSEAHISARRFIRMPPGDLLVHSYDLQHGVHVRSGTRYSLVFWIKDSKTSVRLGSSPWYAKSAKLNDIDAMFNLGGNFLDGLAGEAQDMDKAIEMYNKSAAAGHYMAQCNLGNIYASLYNQTGTESYLSEAFKWLHQSASTGYAKAQKSMAFLLLRQSRSAQVSSWMAKAAEQVDMEAACVLGQFYLRGDFGLKVNLDKALSWLRLSAEMGYHEAQVEFGLLRLNGPTADTDEAKHWLTKAAQRGDMEAALGLAELYAKRGELKTAVRVWKQLAKAGSADAQFQLGRCYGYGRGVKQDWARANRWFRKAAAQGHAEAGREIESLEKREVTVKAVE